MKIDGRCHCGQVEYEAEIDPSAVTICHCTDCQTLSGSAFRANIAAPAATFRILKGTPKQYVKVAESGNRRVQAFCGNCGAHLYACAAESPDSYSLRTGTITQRGSFSVRKQIWRRSALKWIDSVAAVPGVERG
jgi:hypothetical protein